MQTLLSRRGHIVYLHKKIPFSLKIVQSCKYTLGFLRHTKPLLDKKKNQHLKLFNLPKFSFAQFKNLWIQCTLFYQIYIKPSLLAYVAANEPCSCHICFLAASFFCVATLISLERDLYGLPHQDLRVPQWPMSLLMFIQCMLHIQYIYMSNIQYM